MSGYVFPMVDLTTGQITAPHAHERPQQRPKQRPVKRKPPRRPLQRGQQLWDWIKLRGLWPVGLLLIGLTALYVYIVRLPVAMFVQEEFTAVVPGWVAFNKTVLVVHILTALPPLVLGWIGFSKRLRKRSLSLHRWVGTFYCYGIWVSAVTGFMLGAKHVNGFLTAMGYCTLALAWFSTTWIAYRTAKQRNIPAHREWMIRSYAVTLAVVTVRPLTMLPQYVDVGTMDYALFMSWACWIPNIILGELYVRSTDFRGRLVSWRRPKGGAARA